MISVFWNASACLHDRTRGDLTMADVSGEGDEEFAGERDNRNAADPAALGANALAEPAAESTGSWYLTHIQASSTIVDLSLEKNERAGPETNEAAAATFV